MTLETVAMICLKLAEIKAAEVGSSSLDAVQYL